MAEDGGGADERLIVMLEARISEFEKRMAKAERTGTKTYHGLQRGSSRATRQMEADMVAASSKINQALASVSGRVGVFGKAFIGGLGAGLIGAALGNISMNIRGTIGDISDMADAAGRIGLTTDEIQGLQRGFKLAGVEQEQFNGGLEKFVDNIGQAAQGSGALKDILSAHGVELKNTDGSIRSTSELLREFSDIVNAAPDAAAKMALVTDGFGRGGKAMVGAFEGGSAALDKMISDAKDGGYVLEAELVQKAQKLDDKFDNLTMRVDTFFKTLVVGAADAAAAFANVDIGNFFDGDAQADRFLGEKLAAALRANSDLVDQNQEVVATVAAAWNQASISVDGFSTDLSEAGRVLSELGYNEAANEIAALYLEAKTLTGEMRNGALTTDEFEGRVADLAARSVEALSEVNKLDGVNFDKAIGSAGALVAVVTAMRDRALEAVSALAQAAGLSAPASVEDDGRGGQWPEVVVQTPGAGTVRPRRAPALLGEAGVVGATGGGRGGGGGGGSGRVEALLADLQTEREALNAWYVESQALLATATDAQLAQVGGRHEALERLETEHQERLRGIRDGAQGGTLAHAETFFGAMATLTAAGGEKMVKAARATAAAEALINVYRAQAQVLADPKLGFWAKLPAMAAIGAAGMGLVSALGGSGKSKGGGSGGGGSEGGSSTAPVEKAQSPLLLTLQGLDPAQLYQGSQIIALADAIQKEFGKRGLQVGWRA